MAQGRRNEASKAIGAAMAGAPLTVGFLGVGHLYGSLVLAGGTDATHFTWSSVPFSGKTSQRPGFRTPE